MQAYLRFTSETGNEWRGSVIPREKAIAWADFSRRTNPQIAVEIVPVHLPECPASRDDDMPEHEITCTCGGQR